MHPEHHRDLLVYGASILRLAAGYGAGNPYLTADQPNSG
jgi:hypothetical protein